MKGPFRKEPGNPVASPLAFVKPRVPLSSTVQLGSIRDTCNVGLRGIVRLRGIAGTIMALTNHRACPGVLRLVYEKVRTASVHATTFFLH